MALSNENNLMTVLVPLGSVTTDATALPAGFYRRKMRIKSVHVQNGADLAASDSNYVQLALRDGTTVLAEIDSRAAHENGLAANVAKALNLDASKQDVAAGKSLNVLYNETGTVGMTNAVLVISYYPL